MSKEWTIYDKNGRALWTTPKSPGKVIQEASDFDEEDPSNAPHYVRPADNGEDE